jgi:hypothetical protein
MDIIAAYREGIPDVLVSLLCPGSLNTGGG